MANGLKGKQLKLKEEVMQLLAERDESIRQAFSQFHTNIGKYFQQLELKLAVLTRAIDKLGVPVTELEEYAKEMVEAHNKHVAEKGGAPDVGTQNTDASGNSGGDVDNGKQSIGHEKGSELFEED